MWENMEPMVEPAQSGLNTGSDVVRHAGSLRCCLLAIDQDILAVDLNHVREVFRAESITPVPGMPSVVVGVANLRGTVIPLVDLRVLMGTPRTSRLKYAAVVGQGGEQIGILIDNVPEIRTLDLNGSENTAAGESVRGDMFLSRHVNIDSRSSGVVEPAKLVAALEHAYDQHLHGFMIDDHGADTNGRAVVQDEYRTRSDGEENDHGKVE